jgi:hypothetical protein
VAASNTPKTRAIRSRSFRSTPETPIAVAAPKLSNPTDTATTSSANTSQNVISAVRGPLGTATLAVLHPPVTARRPGPPGGLPVEREANTRTQVPVVSGLPSMLFICRSVTVDGDIP